MDKKQIPDPYNGVVFDTELDDFVFGATQMWTLVISDLKNKRDRLKVNPFKEPDAGRKVMEFINRYEKPKIVFHNGLGFDIFIMFPFLGIEHTVGPDTIGGKECEFVDTFYLSMFLNPDREAHSVDHFGSILGLPKIDWRQRAIELGLIESTAPKGAEFKKYHPEMDVYCDRDVDVNMIIYDYLLNEWFDVYGFEFHHTQAYACGQKSFYLMSCQELAGWKFDIEGGIALKKRIAEMMEEIRVKVEPQLPPRALKKAEEKEYTMPAKPFKKNGDLSATMEKFIEKHSLKLVDGVSVIFNGVKYPIVPGSMLDVKLPMEMANQDQMKDWFLEQGWQPTFWNHKKGPDGKPMRDPMTRELIRTSPKIQEQGKLCPNLEKLEGEIAKDVVKWLSLRNRQSVLEGWLENPRLQMDGRIGAGRTGIAATHRQKHKVVVNVPKADPKVLLGYEFRALWIAEEGYLIAAGDAAALEGRVQGHYAYRYDGGVTAEELLKGDVHSKNAYYFYKDIYEEVAELYNAPDFDKENPRWKRYRNPSKNGFYAILYGASGPKVASTLGIPLQYGQAALEAFWEANPGTKALKENVERYWNTVGKKKYLPGIDGRILLTRKKSALLNTIFQSCGGIVMDYAGCYMDRWLGGLKWKDRKPYYEYKGYIVRRIGYFHK